MSYSACQIGPSVSYWFHLQLSPTSLPRPYASSPCHQILLMQDMYGHHLLVLCLVVYETSKELGNTYFGFPGRTTDIAEINIAEMCGPT
jgi:hypothetical protein